MPECGSLDKPLERTLAKLLPRVSILLGISALQAGIFSTPLAISTFQVSILSGISAFQVSIFLVISTFQDLAQKEAEAAMRA
ncbi:hypothetical protein TURU_092463 [Turdus rufiventris]|nr:hypothetical protein TURU_092463 [Turdus rufiventris]